MYVHENDFISDMDESIGSYMQRQECSSSVTLDIHVHVVGMSLTYITVECVKKFKLAL